MDEEEQAEIEAREGQRPEGSQQVAVGIGAGEERELPELPAELPVLPLKNTVLFPFLLSPLLVNTERSKRVIDAVLVSPDRLMLAVAVRGEREGSPGAEDVYRVGTVLRIAKMLKFPDDSYRLVVQGVTRAQVQEFVQESSRSCGPGSRRCPTAAILRALDLTIGRRIQGLLAVYFLVLLLQTLIERELRQAMARAGKHTIPLYPEGRPCARPTVRRLFDVFETV